MYVCMYDYIAEVSIQRGKAQVAAGSCKDVDRTAGRSCCPCGTVGILVVLAPPRKGKDRETLQSTQSTVNRHTSQTKHQSLSKGQPERRITPINTAAVHASAQQQPAIITRTQQGHHQILAANASAAKPMSNTQAGSAALHHRHYPPQRG